MISKDNPDYTKGHEKLEKSVVVKGATESGVKLIQDYNNILRKDEREIQFVLQIVTENRKYTKLLLHTLLCKNIVQCSVLSFHIIYLNL